MRAIGVSWWDRRVMEPRDDPTRKREQECLQMGCACIPRQVVVVIFRMVLHHVWRSQGKQSWFDIERSWWMGHDLRYLPTFSHDVCFCTYDGSCDGHFSSKWFELAFSWARVFSQANLVLILWKIMNDRFLLQMVSWFLILLPLQSIVLWPMFRYEINDACTVCVTTVWYWRLSRFYLTRSPYNADECHVLPWSILTRFNLIRSIFWQDSSMIQF